VQQTTRVIKLGGRRALELPVRRFRIVVEDGPDQGRSLDVSGPAASVGSGEDNDLVLTDRTVSRHHARLALTESGVQVTDLASRNGTWLGGARVEIATVPAGSRVRFGSTRCHLQINEEPLVVCPGEESGFEGLLGSSQPMRDLFAVVKQVARTDLPVLITGETGCGKDLIARALHRAGPRRDRPFIVLDCGSIVPDLLRSELFGHEKGAFTGADRAAAGALEEAAGGTVFLDEVGEMGLAVQPHFLRALESREVTRIGSKKPVRVDFRIVAATNRDLQAMSQDGRFRSDLYYRLSCVTIHAPPLRERLEDIPLLARSFAEACAERNGLTPPHLSGDVLDRLARHSWTGNVRELRNVMESLTAMSAGEPLDARQLDRLLQRPGAAQPSAPTPASLEDAERDVILRMLESTGWRRKEAARRLGISPTTLFAKLKRWGLKPPAE
jgi:DNA-binding NtrC family response regulator